MEATVKISFWYKPFIKFMPKFFEKMPQERNGTFTTRVNKVPFSFVGTVYKGKKSRTYNSIQKAYLKVRWKALWKDWFDFTNIGIEWEIIDETNHKES